MNISDHDLYRIVELAQRKRLVPFLGAGASSCVLPTGADLARHLKDVAEYPDPDERDLARVAQYLQLISDRHHVTKEIVTLLKRRSEDHSNYSPPHRDIARLPVPLYLTTNYDDLMENELKYVGRDPISLYPIWHKGLERITEHDLRNQPVDAIDPTVERPVVYHLHGHWDEPMSILVTEDDYIQFLSALYNPNLLPNMCRRALASDALVFLGYSLRDWNIRLLLAQRMSRPRYFSYAIMQRPANAGLAKFLEMDLSSRSVEILWGTAEEFTREFLHCWTGMYGHL
jgi:hypothetical protein